MALLDGGPPPFGPDQDVGAAPVKRPRLEDDVAAAWAEALGLAAVGPDDDFFDLGGDSLAAVQLLTRLTKRFDVALTEGDLFTARTVAGLSRVIAQGVARAEGRPPLTPINGPRKRFPATAAQKRLWVLDQILPNPEVYNVVYLVRMTGELDAGALRTAFDRLDARQEALRVHFETEDGLPVQVVGDPRPVCLPVVDLTHLPQAAREAEAVRQATEDATERFSLSGERLWRVKLFRTGDAEHYLWLNLHHTIVDGWSVGVIFNDLAAFYDAARTGAAPQLTPLSVQYGDYSVCEQAFRQSPGHKAQLDYWTKVLAEPRPALDLPYAKPRPKWQTFKGARLRFEIPEQLVRAIDRLCRDTAATRFMVGLAAVQTVLHRSTGLGTLLLGTPVANRGCPGVEPLVGLFVNTLVLRTDVRGEWTFRELLDRVRETRAGAFAHQDVSLEAVIEAVRPPRDPSRQPLFQAAYYYQNVTIVPDRFSRLRLERVPVHNGTAMFDFRLVLEDGPGGGLWGWAEYNTDLLEAVHVQTLVGQFLTVLEAATATPARTIATLPLLPPTDYRRIVHDWNRTAGEYPAADRLADAFARRAAARPGAIALVAGGKAITYGQLNERANRLAHYLRAHGIKPGDLVAVCLKRTPDMVAAVLAVCKAGAGYVPLDPGYPRERLAFMLEDTQAKLVLSQWALLDRLPPTGDRLVNLDQIEAELASRPATDPSPAGSPDDVAYVIYTSGSTGKPKGVVVRHRAAVNTIDWVNQTFGVRPDDRLLFVTSLSFDLSVYDIFGVLGAGGSLRIADEHELKDPAKLADLLRTDHITMWDSAPAALQQLTPFLTDRPKSHSLRLVMLSGDWIPVKLPDFIRGVFPNARVMALGGATEAAIWSNWFPVGTVDPAWPSIPYGKPIRNARYHVLDAHLQPVPVGVPGELHIGGLCLADGYLNRPDLTAERFIDDPFAPGERLYKTGDLARYFPDGNIEFLGRIDHQVKVRGFRVELGEIEAALAQHPAVRDAVVKSFKDESGSVCLAAYVVPKAAVESGDLSTHLRAGLPEYMVPSAFVFLDAMPVTANGKVDRAALQPPAAPAATADDGYVPPATDAERALQALFEEALNVRPVSVTARFEDLGGHSLLAAQVVSRIETRLGHKVPLETLFTAPTVRELATVIQRKLELGGGVVVPLNEEGTHPPLFLIAGAGGHVFAFHKFSRLLGADYPVYGMKAVGADGSEPPLSRMEAIAARYLDEIVKVRPKGPYVLAGYSVGGLVAFELALQMRRRGLEVAKVIAFDTHAPGYPRRMALPIRLLIHATNFLARRGSKKWDYLAERFRNVRHRFLTAVGLGHLDLRAPLAVGGLSEQTLKRVWASLERASMRYWPSGKFDGPIVLVSAARAEQWVATHMDDPQKGWGRWTRQPVQVVEVPSGHMDVFEDEHLGVLVREMHGVLKAPRGRRKDSVRVAVGV